MANPPTPGRFVEPDLSAFERAVDRFTFPISKRDLLEAIADDETVILDGRNVELRGVVSDLPDDFFDTEGEFLETLKVHFAAEGLKEGPLAEGEPERSHAP